MFQRVQPSIPSLPSIPSSSISNQPVSSSSAGRVMDHSHLVCCYTAHVTLQWYVFVCLCVRVCVCVCVCVYAHVCMYTFFIFIDINECSKPDICGPGGQCVNSLGSYKCDCLPGYASKSRRHPACEGRNYYYSMSTVCVCVCVCVCVTAVDKCCVTPITVL